MRKYTKGQEVVVLYRRRWDDDNPQVLRGTMVSGGSKNVTIEFTDEIGWKRQESFELQTGKVNVKYGRYTYTFLTAEEHAREQVAKEIEGSFEIAEEETYRHKTISVDVKGRDIIWYETLGLEFEPRRVRLTFEQDGHKPVKLVKIELSGPQINQRTWKPIDDSSATLGRTPNCTLADLRDLDKVGGTNRNSLPEWAWAVAEKVWPKYGQI